MTKPLPFPASLSDKYRPARVKDFIGLVKPKRILEAFIKKPFESAWLYIGPSGTGKTTLAMALGDEINAEIHQISSRACDLEAIRQVTHQCNYVGFNFKTGKAHAWHLVIINEADAMTPAAQEALLSKTDATDPPPRTIFVYTSNTTKTLEDRFLSRTRPIEFTYDSIEGELAGHLRVIYRKEGGKHPLDFEAIASSAGFNVRDALMKIEMELLIGDDRDGLPDEQIKIVEAHTHNCKKCHRPWKHPDPMCELPFRTVCPQCGGASTVGSLRALKAHETMRNNAIAEHEAKKKAGKKKSA